MFNIQINDTLHFKPVMIIIVSLSNIYMVMDI